MQRFLKIRGILNAVNVCQLLFRPEFVNTSAKVQSGKIVKHKSSTIRESPLILFWGGTTSFLPTLFSQNIFRILQGKMLF